jgi:GH15 family glucan-1,4-alpha-glucosidase
MHSVALAGKNGSIDWCCLPRFDSPSIFAAILDCHKGGFFKLAPTGDSSVKQTYLPDTNILVTRFHSDEGMGEVIDFMPIGRESGGQTEQSARQIVRIASVHGNIRFRMECGLRPRARRMRWFLPPADGRGLRIRAAAVRP